MPAENTQPLALVHFIGTASIYRTQVVAESLKLALQPGASRHHLEGSAQEGVCRVTRASEQEESALGEGTFSCHLQCGCLPSACVSFQNLVRSRSSCETVTEGSQSPSDCDRESIPVDADPLSELVDGKNVQHVRLLKRGAPPPTYFKINHTDENESRWP